ncbi:MAG: META domain-containing protein [Draconibacterium sp.]|nr:META domain-containing protein [Draconibacterium sp.]
MNRLHLIFISLLILVIVSCDKSETDEKGVIYGKWEVTTFMSVESAAYPKKNGFNPVIEFKNDELYSLILDVNSCSGSFTLMAENNISISSAGCTKICCDSEFSKKFVTMLLQVNRYSIEGNKMKLNIPGWGWIELMEKK